jgi:hypothetical protein
MKTTNLITALRRLSVEDRPTACLGCGQEHGCSVHGCAILRGAAEWIAAAEKDMVLIRDCGNCKYDMAAMYEEPCKSCNCCGEWEWRGPQGV